MKGEYKNLNSLNLNNLNNLHNLNNQNNQNTQNSQKDLSASKTSLFEKKSKFCLINL